MHYGAVLSFCGGILIASTAYADEQQWRPDLIAAYESDGGRNVPNFRFDGTDGPHSAGGVCQMLTSTYLPIARSIDIDVEKFPVLGTLPEFDQWRACWKLWSVRGYEPWTCCNSRLKRALKGEKIDAAVRPAMKDEKREEPRSERITFLMARLAASSNVFSLPSRGGN